MQRRYTLSLCAETPETCIMPITPLQSITMKTILLIVAPYYQEISKMLVAGATARITEAGHRAETVSVPGALEIPAAIAMALRSERYTAFIALGCVIRGETSHYNTVATESAHALQLLAIGHHHAAIGNGILTCENMAQAIERANPEQGNKGGEAARAALCMMDLRQRFRLDMP